MSALNLRPSTLLPRSHARRPATPSGLSAPRCSTASQLRARERGVRVVEPRARDACELSRVHTWAHLARLDRRPAGRPCSIARHVHLPGERSISRARGRRRRRRRRGRAVGPGRARAGARASAGPPRGARGRPWDSASSTTWRLRRPPARAAGSRRVAIVDIDVHHGNGTERIVLRRSARAVHLDPPMAVLSRAPARPTDIGQRRRARGSRSTCRIEAGATDGDYAGRVRAPSSCRCSTSSRRSSCSSRRASTRTNAIRWRRCA